MDSRSIALYSDLLADLVPHLHGAPDGVLSPDLVGDVAPWPGITLSGFRSLSLLKSFLKKYEELDQDEQMRADSAALEKFKAANLRCGSWEMSTELWSWEEEAFGELKQLLWKFFNPSSPSGPMPLLDANDIIAVLATGPGASLQASGDSFYHKVAAGPLTTTSEYLYLRYLSYVDSYPLWQEAELRRIVAYGGADVVKGSKLGFAPKSPSCSRTICTEPSLNMMFQKGIDALLRERLKCVWGIDLQAQEPKNQELARIGSIDGSYATIDLESASDTISLKLLESILDKECLLQLKLARSPCTFLPNGERVELAMISSMGNGYTFSLETIIFSAIVLTSYKMLGIPAIQPRPSALGTFAVYGDDMVVDGRAYRLVTRLLELCGFVVNTRKSFCTGDFRESCGKDWLLGQPVRGVYCRHLKRSADRYSLLNRLNRWSATTGTCLKRVCRRLVKSVPEYVVPLTEGDDAGIKLPFRLVRDLKRSPFLAVTPGSKAAGLQTTLVYKKLTPRPLKIPVSCAEEVATAWNLEGLYSNPPGLLLSAVAGHLMGGAIGIRTLGAGRTRTVVSVCPSWDYVDQRVPEMGTKIYSTHSRRPEGFPAVGQLEVACRANLTNLLEP